MNESTTVDSQSPRTLVVGIGSAHGDDQAGWLVVRRLAKRLHKPRSELRPHVDVHLASSPADLLNWLEGHHSVIICDAYRGDDQVGRIRQWRWPHADIDQTTWTGTHDLSLPAALSLAETLDCLPDKVSIWGIALGSALPTDELSPVVSRSISALVDQLSAELSGTP